MVYIADSDLERPPMMLQEIAAAVSLWNSYTDIACLLTSTSSFFTGRVECCWITVLYACRDTELFEPDRGSSRAV